jgi:hypothetical protein
VRWHRDPRGHKDGHMQCADVEGGPESIKGLFSSRTHEYNRQHPGDKLEQTTPTHFGCGGVPSGRRSASLAFF